MTPLEFLEALYSHCEPGWLSTFAIHRATGQQHIQWHTTDQLDQVIADAGRLQGCDIWWGIATRSQRLERGRGGAADCQQLPALWVDIDVATGVHARNDLPPHIDAAHILLADHPLGPTHIVHTGGGLHAYWKLAEPLDCADAPPVLAAWRDTWVELARRRDWHIDTGVFDTARVLRLPGTQNMKGQAA